MLNNATRLLQQLYMHVYNMYTYSIHSNVDDAVRAQVCVHLNFSGPLHEHYTHKSNSWVEKCKTPDPSKIDARLEYLYQETEFV